MLRSAAGSRAGSGRATSTCTRRRWKSWTCAEGEHGGGGEAVGRRPGGDSGGARAGWERARRDPWLKAVWARCHGQDRQGLSAPRRCAAVRLTCSRWPLRPGPRGRSRRSSSLRAKGIAGVGAAETRLHRSALSRLPEQRSNGAGAPATPARRRPESPDSHSPLLRDQRPAGHAGDARDPGSGRSARCIRRLAGAIPAPCEWAGLGRSRGARPRRAALPCACPCASRAGGRRAPFAPPGDSRRKTCRDHWEPRLKSRAELARLRGGAGRGGRASAVTCAGAIPAERGRSPTAARPAGRGAARVGCKFWNWQHWTLLRARVQGAPPSPRAPSPLPPGSPGPRPRGRRGPLAVSAGAARGSSRAGSRRPGDSECRKCRPFVLARILPAFCP